MNSYCTPFTLFFTGSLATTRTLKSPSYNRFLINTSHSTLNLFRDRNRLPISWSTGFLRLGWLWLVLPDPGSTSYHRSGVLRTRYPRVPFILTSAPPKAPLCLVFKVNLRTTLCRVYCAHIRITFLVFGKLRVRFVEIVASHKTNKPFRFIQNTERLAMSANLLSRLLLLSGNL